MLRPRTLRACFLAITAALGACAIVACASDGEEETAAADGALINGRADDSFSATVVIENGCTATKVGPRHVLLAAHCIEAYFGMIGPGTHVRIGTGALRSGLTWNVVTIDRIFVEPNRKQACDVGCVSTEDPRGARTADVAVVTTKEALDFVPATAKVDLDPVVPGDELYVVGAGCEKYVRQEDFDYAKRRIKSGKTYALSPYDAFHPGSHLNMFGNREQTAATYAGSYFATPGPDEERGAPGLCPGDSGGPVYRADARDVVVGVNSTYTFVDLHASRSVPKTNGHTRLDAASSHRVGDWLASLGVQTTRSCATRACRPMPDGGALAELDAGVTARDSGRHDGG